MSPLSTSRLGITAAIMGAVAFVVSRFLIDGGHTPTAVSWVSLLVSAAVAVMILWLGWTVRQYRAGSHPGLSALRAARTAVLSQAVAYTGAIMAGGFGGYALAVGLEWGHAPRREVAISALVAMLGAIAMAGAGRVAEHWCKIGGDDEDDAAPPDASPA
ncbi:DUF3180 domain-containing protein [Demequina lignilytica]|uniref:DUF3180 domain-containing protein n=1 Tax=Demequina lignilytica TaxID=3051663 RepID=A0AB35MK59_9MICO|nr:MULTISPECIES: DUF3180 domain-containing protein [unclassified Demequina]MDN4484211.1 DUF3180 domain-containing protein [Demequina sp. SYSU T0a273]MDN4490622.1 DUF3180 domain-containing protein [Demequina sp. SYSU T00068]